MIRPTNRLTKTLRSLSKSVVATASFIFLLTHAMAQVNDTETLQTPVTTNTDVYAIKSITLKPGFTVTAGVKFTAKILVDGYGTYTGADSKPKNWTESKVFNGNQVAVGHSRSYFDWMGRSVQSQSADFTTGRAVVSEVVYDALGRQAITTLPAAVVSPNLAYKANFFTDPYGKDYSSANFDSTKLINPDKVNAAIPEGLGWYYSANNTAEAYVAESTHPYSRVEYSSLTGMARKSAAAGNYYRMGSGHETYGFSMPASIDELGAYASNKGLPSYGLSKTISVDADGKMYATFTDAGGNTIATARVGGNVSTTAYVYPSSLKWVDIFIGAGCENSLVLPNGHTFSIYNLENDSFVKTTTGSGSTTAIGKGFYRIVWTLGGEGTTGNNFEISYTTKYSELALYVYDNTGRLICSYSPKTIESNTGSPTITYKYNTLGWLLETNSVDEGLSQFVYRKDGAIRFSQNAKQRAVTANKVFSYTNYDISGRPVESGEYRGTIAFSSTMNPETILPENSCFDRTLTTYDVPDASLSSLKAGYIQDFTAGRVSKTQNDNSTTWYSYTYDGRVDWIVRKVNSMNPISVNYAYDFNGNVTNVVYQKDVAAERFEHVYSYDANLRLAKVETRALNSDPLTLQAKYHYYAHGPLKRVEYGTNLQGVDYTYTENGALKAINDPLLSSDDPGKDGYAGTRSGFGKDLFGMALDYFNGDYIRKNTNIGSIAGSDGDSYSGLIKAQRWRTRHANVEPTSADQSWLYRYTYDSRGYLTDANFGTYDRSTTTAVTGDAYSERGITYDINGNITALTRYSSTNTLMDQIAYTCGNSSKPNQLSKVNDSATDNTFSALPSGESSFTYNAIGQMVSRTEGGVTEYYQYTPYGLVEGVYTDAAMTNPRVRYAYDESGFRYWTKEYSSAEQKETFHIRDASGNILATYEKKGAASIAQAELPVYGSSRIGVITRGDMHTTYELTDHLGNVRALFGKDASNTVRMEGYTDYYPYGMAMPNRQYTLGSRYRFGYQGQFAEKDEETGLDHFEARDYDSRLGRWLINDPAGQFWSPYLAMGNNPVSGVDPDGRFVPWFENGQTGELFWNPNLNKGDEYLLGDNWRYLGEDNYFGFDPSWDLLQGLGGKYTSLLNNYCYGIHFSPDAALNFAKDFGFVFAPLEYYQLERVLHNGYPITSASFTQKSGIQVWEDATYVGKYSQKSVSIEQKRWGDDIGFGYSGNIKKVSVRYRPGNLFSKFGSLFSTGYDFYSLSFSDDKGMIPYLGWDKVPSGTLLEPYRPKKP